jgi:hypothetical protein
LYLRNVQGYGWNHKRVYRIYCELELNLRIKPKKRLKRDKPEPLAVPDKPNETWSITGDKTSKEIARYTKSANQKVRAERAIDKMSATQRKR